MSSIPLSVSLPGSWLLLSRIDIDHSGVQRSEPSLGENPIALLIYDCDGHFAVQFMSQDRSIDVPDGPSGAPNNSRAQGGYDAYFGTYIVDNANGSVTQRLLGALSNEHVGSVLTRRMDVQGDILVIRLETATSDGSSVTRTLTWQRLGRLSSMAEADHESNSSKNSHRGKLKSQGHLLL